MPRSRSGTEASLVKEQSMLTFRNIKTVLQLKKFVERGADSFYFSADEMEGFGDTFSNYGVRHIRLKRRDADDVINAIELY